MRSSLGSTDSKPVTLCPASARCRVRAVRKMVSPSGISGCLRYRWFGNPPHLETDGGRHEAGLFQEACQEVIASRSFVDVADEQAAAAALPANGDFGKLAREFAGKAGALRFVLGQQYLYGGIAPAQKGRKLTVDENHARPGGARHGVIGAGPGQQAAVGIGRVA